MAKRVRQRSAEPERRPNRQTSTTKPTDVSVMSAPVLPAPERPAAEAVSLFECAMRALQRHEYAAAAEAFR